MRHGMNAKLAEGDLLHLAVGGMIFNPLFVAAEGIPRMQHRRMALCGIGQFGEPAAGEFTQRCQVRHEMREQRRLHVEREKIPQAAINLVKVQAAAGRRQCAGSGRGSLTACAINVRKGGVLVHSICNPTDLMTSRHFGISSPMNFAR